MNNIEIRKVANNDPKLKEFVLSKHYLKRLPSSKISYGLFDNEEMVGVAIYGLPSAPLTKKFNNEIIELVRLFTLDTHKHIPLSMFLTKTLKMLKQDVPQYKMVISFAQLNANHTGAIYQATSWIYTGLTKSQNDYKVRGIEKKHPRGILMGLTVKEVREILGNDFYTIKRPKKARYFFPLNKRKNGIKTLSRLEYDIIDQYPKLNDTDIQEQIKIDMDAKKVANNFDQTKYEEVKAKINHYKNNNNITKEENVIKGGNNE